MYSHQMDGKRTGNTRPWSICKQGLIEVVTGVEGNVRTKSTSDSEQVGAVSEAIEGMFS